MTMDAPTLEPRPRPGRQAADATYTCPMHPQVRRPAPGPCPICGMALEPALPSAEDPGAAELADMSRRLAVGAALTVPLVAISMAGASSPLGRALGPAAGDWLQLALATPVVLWAGWPLLQRGWASIASRRLNMFTLIAMGACVAWGSSVVATIASIAPPHPGAG